MEDTPSGPILGIIGGAGVGAAARLYIDVAAGVRAATGSLPRIALWNVPFGDSLEHAFTSAAPDPELIEIAERLVAEAIDRLLAAGAAAIAMPCNSLQQAASREAERRGIPFIDMIAATMDAARASGNRSAVLIATETTRAAGFYEGYDMPIVAPPSALRQETSSLIARAVGGPLPGAAEMRSLVERARIPGASVVLGCTDICGLLEADAVAELAVVESLGCLVERCVGFLSAGLPAAAISATNLV